jgi:hypothetical protein
MCDKTVPSGLGELGRLRYGGPVNQAQATAKEYSPTLREKLEKDIEYHKFDLAQLEEALAILKENPQAEDLLKLQELTRRYR